ncbi:hypothetical protein ACROYT_G044503 [Oculina patagonica]
MELVLGDMSLDRVMPKWDKYSACYILRSCLGKEPTDAIKGVEDDIQEMWKRLDEKYGDPAKVADAIINTIQSVRPIKKGKEKTVRGVCFSPPKRKRFASFFDNNSPVKIKKFQVDTKSNTEDLLMGHDVNIEHFQAIDFDKEPIPTTMSLATIKSVCPGQIVTVTAKVTHLFPSKTVGSKPLQVQNAIIADPSGTTKLTLWENFVGTIKQGNTYTFRDICVYKDKLSHETCLNTAKSGTTIEPAPEFQGVLPVAVLESNTANGEIIRVNQVASYLSCCKCNKKVDPSTEHSFIECPKCHFKQKKTACKTHWFAQCTKLNKAQH